MIVDQQRFQVVQQAADGQRFVTPEGECVQAPADWILVPASDPACRRLLAAGPALCVLYAAGKSRFTTGVLVPPERMSMSQHGREQDSLQDKLIGLLDFPPRHADVARDLAATIAGRIGSGLVAGGRSLTSADLETAILQWLQQHVESEDMPRRSSPRSQRRMHNRALCILDEYRIGLPRDPALCPLVRALAVEAERN